MLPRLLTGNNLPQTLLLTALALLIAAATTMLACGPAAAPAPADSNALPAAPQADGNGAEPAAEPTATPTPEPKEPTATPTVEPTATRVPNATECFTIPPEYQDTPELAEGQVRRDGIKYQCFVVTPTPTPKYPELGSLNWLAVAGEEAEAQRAASLAGGVSGASGQAEVEVPIVHIRVAMDSNTADVVAWLQSKGMPLPQDRGAGDEAYIADYAVDWEFGNDYIYVYIPASLLLPLSKQPGVAWIVRAPPGPSPD